MRWRGGKCRGSWGVLVAAVLAVLALVSACVEVDTDRGKEGGRGAEAGERASSSGAATSPRIPSGTDLPGSSVAVDFARDGSGFALLAECGKTRCRQRVAVLDKGADAWRLECSPLPDVTVEHGITATLRVLGPGRALIREGVWPPPDRTWFTSDGGRHWQEGSAKPSGTTPVLPEGVTLFEDCTRMDQEGNNCEHARVLTFLPGTGEFWQTSHTAMNGQLLVVEWTSRSACGWRPWKVATIRTASGAAQWPAPDRPARNHSAGCGNARMG